MGMGMQGSYRPSGARFLESAARSRIAGYRDQAAQFREMAELEPVARVRAHLLHLADEYHAIADELESTGG